MRDHPIPPVTESLQYRAIGLIRAVYAPADTEQLTRGRLIDADGHKLNTVVLGRMLTLMRRHLPMGSPHLWVVYPRCREEGRLHLQIAGVWEPSTLAPDASSLTDSLPEGDNFFSVRGELVFTKPKSDDLVVKIRQRRRPDGSRPLPFKIRLHGKVPLANLRHFVSFDVRRYGQELRLESYKVISQMPSQRSERSRQTHSRQQQDR